MYPKRGRITNKINLSFKEYWPHQHVQLSVTELYAITTFNGLRLGRTKKHLEHLEHLMSILAHLWEIESLYFAQIKYLGKCEHPMLKSIQWLQNNNNDGYYKVKNFRPYFFEYPKLKSISFDFKVEISYWHNNVSIPYL